MYVKIVVVSGVMMFKDARGTVINPNELKGKIVKILYCENDYIGPDVNVVHLDVQEVE